MFFRLNRAWQQKIIGVKDASSQLRIDKMSFNSMKEYEDFASFFSWERYWKDINAFPDFQIKVDKAHLIESAKLTDFMSYYEPLPGVPFIIKNRIKNIFEDLKLRGLYYYPINIYSGSRLISDEYFILHTSVVSYDAILFNKSILVKTLDDEPLKIIKINTVDELEKSYKAYKLSEFKKLTLKKEFLFNQDFIKTRMSDIFISEFLKDIFIQEKVTGIDIRESDVLAIE